MAAQSYLTVYSLGAAARKAGVPATANPWAHAHGTAFRHREWLRGHGEYRPADHYA